MARQTLLRHWGMMMGFMLLLGGLALVLPTARVAAATYTVNALTDNGTGVGTTGDLRYAITQVNAGAGGDTITITAHGTIPLGSKLPVLNKNVTITGPGASLLTINGNHAVRGFEIAPNVTVNLSSVTIANGSDSGSGGAIYVGPHATLTVTNGVFSGNNADDNGGAIENLGGTVTATNCTFASNTASRGGGGAISIHTDSQAFQAEASLTVTGSTFIGNVATVNTPQVGHGGGAILNHGDEGPLNFYVHATITNSTFFNNSVGSNSNGGGAISSYEVGNTASGTYPLTLINDTITGNHGNIATGGVYSPFTAIVINTIISGNTVDSGDPDVRPAAAFSSATTSIIGGNPVLGTLGDHGGPTQTIPLLPGSPAIAAGTAGGSAPTTDQRGVARTGHTDIGAFQSQGFTVTKGSGDNQSTRVGQLFPAPLTITVTANQPGAPWNEPVQGGTLYVSAPTSGASATISNVPPLPASGQGSVTLTANFTGGGPYTVKVGVSSLVTASFSLTNTPAAAHTTFTVGSIADHAGGQTSVAACTTAANTTCTLRDAVSYAVSGTDAIAFNGTGQGTITLDPALGTLELGHNVTITGPGAMTLTVARIAAGGIAKFRIFWFHPGTTVSVSGMTITGGDADTGDGGGILSQGTLSLTDVAVQGSGAGSNGGGIEHNGGGTLTLTKVTLSGNAANTGGGLDLSAATVIATNVTISGNRAVFGGGLEVNNGGGVATLTNVTITDNNASAHDTGGINNIGGTVNATRTIIAGNTEGVAFHTINGTNVNNLTDGDPLLAPLAIYGGTTQTHALLPGSPAINAGGACAGTDQRGVARALGGSCDIGAFESRGFTLAKSSGDTQFVLPGQAFAPLDVLVSGSNGEPVQGGVVTFTGPASGAGIATSPKTATIAANGHASVTLTANGTQGTYSVTAGARGTTPATVSFTLTNAVTPPPFTVTTIAPSSGTTAGGEAVTITGTGFAAGATVSIGGVACTNVQVVTSTTLTCTTGAHAAGAVDVAVTVGGTTKTLVGGYTYTAGNTPPTLTLSAITPASGPVLGGATVTLTGTGFGAGATVSIGGVACMNVQMVSGTTLSCTTGAHVEGIVDVMVTVGGTTKTLVGGYAYGVIPPQSRQNPSAGTPGSPVPPPSDRAPGTTGTTGGAAPIPPPIPRPADS